MVGVASVVVRVEPLEQLVGSDALTTTPLELRLAARDTLVIASDGLFDNVLQDEIVEIIRKGPLGEAVAELLTLARRRMEGEDADKPSKPDDFSAILFRPKA